MTWNWLAWKRAYQIAAVEPKTLWTLRPKSIRARALQRPRMPRTVRAVQVSFPCCDRTIFTAIDQLQNDEMNLIGVLPNSCNPSPLPPTRPTNGRDNPLSTSAPANVLGTLPGNATWS